VIRTAIEYCFDISFLPRGRTTLHWENATFERKTRKADYSEDLKLRHETDIQPPRRREGVARAKERIELFVGRKVRRGRDLPQV
jgi:hypothetical protein